MKKLAIASLQKVILKKKKGHVKAVVICNKEIVNSYLTLFISIRNLDIYSKSCVDENRKPINSQARTTQENT